MKGLTALLLGIFGTFAFSWLGLTVIPTAQIGHLDPQVDEDGNDPYPAPKAGLTDRGRQVYVANGCAYCHSQQVRPDYAAADIERKWGERRSAPRDYIFERPVLLGTMRMGPDLANIGRRPGGGEDDAPAPDATTSTTAGPAAAAPGAAPAAGAPSAPGAPAPSNAAGAAPPAPPPSGAPLPQASESKPSGGNGTPSVPAPVEPGGGPSPAPAVAAQTADTVTDPTTTAAGPNNEPLLYSAAWHHRHLYDPRSINPYSIMPSFRFLYEKRRISGQPSADAVNLGGPAVAPDGWEVVPSYDAKALVAYLMSLDQTHALKEVKSSGPVSPPAPGKAVK